MMRNTTDRDGVFCIRYLVPWAQNFMHACFGGSVLGSGNRFECGLPSKSSRRNSVRFLNCFLQVAAASLSISRLRAFLSPVLAILERNFGMRLWEREEGTHRKFLTRCCACERWNLRVSGLTDRHVRLVYKNLPYSAVLHTLREFHIKNDQNIIYYQAKDNFDSHIAFYFSTHPFNYQPRSRQSSISLRKVHQTLAC